MSFDVSNKLKLYETGQLLKSKRLSRGLSLQQVGEQLSISTNYVSEVERGLKLPSDNLIEKFATFYQIDTNYLFQSFDKIPKIIRNATKENSSLQKAILEVEERTDLSEADKEIIYDELYYIMKLLLSKKRKGV